MGTYGNAEDAIKATKFRRIALQAIQLGMVLMMAFILRKGIVCFTGCESPAFIVLSGSMEPAMRRGDCIFLYNGKSPIRAGEIIVFNVEGHDKPIVHRVIKVHENVENGSHQYLTKGDNNNVDDRFLYAQNQSWLQRHHIVGRVVGILPYVGWIYLIITENPFIKYFFCFLMGATLIFEIFEINVSKISKETYNHMLETLRSHGLFM